MILPLLLTLSGCYAIDGDTLRCGRERIRLVGIDAPEMRGHCRRGRRCAPGSGEASKRSLQRTLTRVMDARVIGRDRYGRILAVVKAGSVNIACLQLQRGQAIYKPQWDNGKVTAKACGM